MIDQEYLLNELKGSIAGIEAADDLVSSAESVAEDAARQADRASEYATEAIDAYRLARKKLDCLIIKIEEADENEANKVKRQVQRDTIAAISKILSESFNVEIKIE